MLSIVHSRFASTRAEFLPAVGSMKGRSEVINGPSNADDDDCYNNVG